METVSNTAVNPPDAKRMLAACGFSIGQKVQVFDGQKWEKTGDIGDNECFWIEATCKYPVFRTGYKLDFQMC
jgi:hypothetical protein